MIAIFVVHTLSRLIGTHIHTNKCDNRNNLGIHNQHLKLVVNTNEDVEEFVLGWMHDSIEVQKWQTKPKLSEAHWRYRWAPTDTQSFDQEVQGHFQALGNRWDEIRFNFYFLARAKKSKRERATNDGGGVGGWGISPTAFRVSKSGLRCCRGRLGSARDFQAAFKPLLLPLLLLPSLVESEL